jgi:hypothetical protein
MVTKQLNIRFGADDLQELQNLANHMEITAAALGAILLRAALRAARNESGGLRLPVDFQIVQPETARNPVRAGGIELNEPSTLKNKRK